MWFPAVVTTAPVAEPLTLASAKLQIVVEDTPDDALISDYISAARAHVESATGLRLYTQTLAMRCDAWADLTRLPVAPIQSLTSVTYVDTAGATQTLSALVYETRLYGLEPGLALIDGQSWPDTRKGSLITVTVIAGYGDQTAQPPAVIQAMRLLIGDFYAFRETAATGAMASIPTAAAVEALLANERVHLIA